VIRRLPMLLLVSGALLKVALIAGLRMVRSPTILDMVTVYDLVSFWLAEQGVGLAFDQRRIFPTAHEAIVFEVLLVLGFALQCFLLGMILRAIAVRLFPELNSDFQVSQ
jgi:hypothetical protein